MAKKDFINVMATAADIPASAAEKAYNSFVAYFIEELNTKNLLLVPGIGSFKKKRYGPRNSRNPRTGEPVVVPAKNKVKFTMSKSFTEEMAVEIN